MQCSGSWGLRSGSERTAAAAEPDLAAAEPDLAAALGGSGARARRAGEPRAPEAARARRPGALQVRVKLAAFKIAKFGRIFWQIVARKKCCPFRLYRH